MSIKLSLGDPEIIQVQLLKIDHDKKLLICFVNNEDDKNCIVRYDISPDNNIFTPSVEQFWEGQNLTW